MPCAWHHFGADRRALQIFAIPARFMADDNCFGYYQTGYQRYAQAHSRTSHRHIIGWMSCVCAGGYHSQHDHHRHHARMPERRCLHACPGGLRSIRLLSHALYSADAQSGRTRRLASDNGTHYRYCHRRRDRPFRRLPPAPSFTLAKKSKRTYRSR